MNLVDGNIQLGLRGNEDIGWEDGDFGDFLDAAARDGIETLDGIDLVIPKHNTVGDVGVGRKNVERLPFNTELALGELYFVTRIECVDQGLGHLVALGFLPPCDVDDVLAEVIRIADTVET